MAAHDPASTYGAWIAAWDTPEPDKRRRLLEECFAEDGVATYPGGRYVGREAVSALIARAHSRTPGLRIVQTTGVEAHHGALCAGWRISGSDGTVLREGLDAAEVDPDGRLRRVLGFHDPPPPLN
jgi:hypothetical protein